MIKNFNFKQRPKRHKKYIPTNAAVVRITVSIFRKSFYNAKKFIKKAKGDFLPPNLAIANWALYFSIINGRSQILAVILGKSPPLYYQEHPPNNIFDAFIKK